jgi:hypothetical protein
MQPKGNFSQKIFGKNNGGGGLCERVKKFPGEILG